MRIYFVAVFLYALLSVLQPDWLIGSSFRFTVSNDLHRDIHQNSWIATSKKVVLAHNPQIPHALRFT